jgi:hypothetical protein
MRFFCKVSEEAANKELRSKRFGAERKWDGWLGARRGQLTVKLGIVAQQLLRVKGNRDRREGERTHAFSLPKRSPPEKFPNVKAVPPAVDFICFTARLCCVTQNVGVFCKCHSGINLQEKSDWNIAGCPRFVFEPRFPRCASPATTKRSINYGSRITFLRLRAYQMYQATLRFRSARTAQERNS